MMQFLADSILAFDARAFTLNYPYSMEKDCRDQNRRPLWSALWSVDDRTGVRCQRHFLASRRWLFSSPASPRGMPPREKHQQNIRTIPYDTVRFRAIPYDTVRYRAIRAHMCLSHCPVGG